MKPAIKEYWVDGVLWHQYFGPDNNCVRARMQRAWFNNQWKLNYERYRINTKPVGFFTKWFRYLFVTPKPPKHRPIPVQVVASRSHTLRVAEKNRYV